jgi:hypothetical protein
MIDLIIYQINAKLNMIVVDIASNVNKIYENNSMCDNNLEDE